MSKTKPENQIDYVRLPDGDIARAKAFYSAAFGWKFEDHGPDYTSFFDGRLSGGFTTEVRSPAQGLLLVIYSSDLESSQERIKNTGGKIAEATSSFAGGRIAHFADPHGTGLAVWSDF